MYSPLSGWSLIFHLCTDDMNFFLGILQLLLPEDFSLQETDSSLSRNEKKGKKKKAASQKQPGRAVIKG